MAPARADWSCVERIAAAQLKSAERIGAAISKPEVERDARGGPGEGHLLPRKSARERHQGIAPSVAPRIKGRLFSALACFFEDHLPRSFYGRRAATGNEIPELVRDVGR